MAITGQFAVADALHLPLADKSVDLVLGSPPYCDARTYGIGAQRDCAEWVEWMLSVTDEALRVSRGAVIWVAAGVTRDWTYWPACEGLMWEWWKRGGSMFRPVYWHRLGIPGSGGEQWFRADVEYCMCFKRPGKLPWTDNTAMGHVPAYAPGGAFANWTANGGRANDPWNKRGRPSGIGGRTVSGEKKLGTMKAPNGQKGGDLAEYRDYSPPAIANPGTLISTGAGGGGQLGHSLAHENEAPYPEDLCGFFIRSLCPPNGLVCDPYSGSGTTVAAAMKAGRNGIGFDIRESQVKLGYRRIAGITPPLFTEAV